MMEKKVSVKYFYFFFAYEKITIPIMNPKECIFINEKELIKIAFKNIFLSILNDANIAA